MILQIWNPDWFPLPGQAVFDRERQQIAAVSRASGNLDLFIMCYGAELPKENGNKE